MYVSHVKGEESMYVFFLLVFLGIYTVYTMDSKVLN